MRQCARLITSLICVSLLYGCAAPQTKRIEISNDAMKAEAVKQMEMAVQDMVEEQKRITRVYSQLAIKAERLCGFHVGPHLGAYFVSKQKGELGDTLAKLYNVKEQPTVLFMLEGGPGERAGLKAQDVLVSVNGLPVSTKESLEKIFEGVGPNAPMTIKVNRDGADVELKIMPITACKYAAQLMPDQVINAFADGNKIMIARGMMNFARDDNELALVLSHEMAHNTMRHIDAKKKNMNIGLIADIASLVLSKGRTNTNFAQMAGNAYSQDFEAEADYVGLYIMAVAGLPITDAPKFWRRMASAHPANIKTNHSASHPSTSYRMLALEETVKEITDKIAKREVLQPNMKNGNIEPPKK